MNSTSWLLDVAHRANLPRAEMLPPELPEGTEDAWATVSRACNLEPWALAKIVAKHYGLEVAPHLNRPDFKVMQLLPEAFARRYGVLPIHRSNGEILVAIGYPPDKTLAERLHFATELAARFVIAPPGVIVSAMMAAYESARRAPEGVEVGHEDGAYAGALATEITLDATEDPSSTPVVRLANLLLSEAIRLEATDIHLQPVFAGGMLRIRVDGKLRRKAFLPSAVARRLIGRMKAISSMDPTDRMHPQDGRLRVRRGDAVYDLRLSTLPVEDGEKLVIRILPHKAVLGLNRIELAAHEAAQFNALLARGAGLVLVTGPTGCGKTTTLHAAIADRNTNDVSIVTVEDPIEYRLPRLAQVQVNPESGLTFAAALRAVLRQDPDIVLVGEIRDAETAELALQAALTGHLVLSTLHTLDAVSAIPRLLDLGARRSFLGEALAGVMAQRLVRRLCEKCRVPAAAPLTADEERMARAGVETQMRAGGCPACAFSGFRGRIVIAQVIEVTPPLRQLIDDGAKLDALRANARAGGTRLLAEAALERIRAGETTVSEALAEIGSGFWLELGIDVPVAGAMPEEEAGAKVLVVEQDSVARKALRLALEKAGFTVEEAPHASAAGERIERSPDFCAMVLDLDGMLTERVQRLLALRNSLAGFAMPVVAITDDRAPALDEAVRAHGSTTLLPKPIDPAHVVAALQGALR